MQTLKKQALNGPLDLFVNSPRPVFWCNHVYPVGTWRVAHTHPGWGELAYLEKGQIALSGNMGRCFVPAQWAVWIPGTMAHEWVVTDTINDRTLHIDTRKIALGPRFERYHAMLVTPLMRELILALDTIPANYESEQDCRFVQFLLDRLVELPEVEFLPSFPEDNRIVTLCTSLLSDSSSNRTLKDWGKILCMSERNLARLFKKETGVSFGRWRARVRLYDARRRLERGEKVTTVAMECGYASLSSFIDAFKKFFGCTPGSFACLPTGHAAHKDSKHTLAPGEDAAFSLSQETGH